MKLLTNKRLKDIEDWHYSKGYDEGINKGYKLGKLHGEVEARNRWIIEGFKPPGNTTVEDIEEYLRR